MKKLTSVLFSFILLVTLLGFGVNSVEADYSPGCTANFAYSSTTGKPCDKGCTPASIFSSTTGNYCDSGCAQGVVYSPVTGKSCDGGNITNLPEGCSSTSGFSTTTGRSCKIEDIVLVELNGPQSLNVNQAGTWKVNAYDSNGKELSYSVIWGDETEKGPSYNRLQKSSSFSHTYSKTGIYTPLFTITNGVDIIKSGLNVNVGIKVLPSINITTPKKGDYYDGDSIKINVGWKDYKGDFLFYRVYIGNTISGSESLLSQDQINKFSNGFSFDKHDLEEFWSNLNGYTLSQIENAYYVHVVAVVIGGDRERFVAEGKSGNFTIKEITQPSHVLEIFNSTSVPPHTVVKNIPDQVLGGFEIGLDVGFPDDNLPLIGTIHSLDFDILINGVRADGRDVLRDVKLYKNKGNTQIANAQTPYNAPGRYPIRFWDIDETIWQVPRFSDTFVHMI